MIFSSVQFTVRSPPKSFTVTSLPAGHLPRATAAATAAQAPVPQASVSPLPRSQVRMRSVVGFTTRTNSVFVRSGKASWYSNFGPMAARSRASMPSQNSTQWGLPTSTQTAA